MTKISIALATYNGQDYIAEQLNSILEQTLRPDEIIIGDDCSTDATIAKIESFLPACNIPIRLTCNTSRLGFRSNFQSILKRCSGDIIFLSDQDDYWYPQKIATVISALNNNKFAWLAIHDGDLADNKLVKSGLTKFQQIRHIYGGKSHPKTGALSAVRRSSLSLILPTSDHYISHDQWIHDFAGSLPGKVIRIDISLQLIRRHESNTSTTPISSLKKESRFKFLLNHIITSKNNPALDKVSLNQSIINRLTTISPELKQSLYLTDTQIERTLFKSRKQLKFIEMRKDVQKSIFPLRQIKALLLFLKGGYHKDTFPWNFLKDFLLT